MSMYLYYHAFRIASAHLLPVSTFMSTKGKSSKRYCTYYTPDIRSMWGYIVFLFPFARLFVRTYVSSFVCPCVGSSFRHRVKVFALKFIRPHILKTL